MFIKKEEHDIAKYNIIDIYKHGTCPPSLIFYKEHYALKNTHIGFYSPYVLHNATYYANGETSLSQISVDTDFLSQLNKFYNLLSHLKEMDCEIRPLLTSNP